MLRLSQHHPPDSLGAGRRGQRSVELEVPEVLGELRGRREARFREGVKYIAGWAAGAGFVAELLQGLRPDGSASVLRGVMLVAAALYGSYLYHLQRAHVRRLLGRS